MNTIRSLDLRWPATVAGVAYALAIVLVATQADTDPVGANYAAFNRMLSVALVLLALSGLALRDRIAGAGLPGRRPAGALAVGMAVMAAGSIVEFWGALVAGRPTEAMAERTGEQAFAGSGVGFAIFLLGGVVVLVTPFVLARAVRRWPGADARLALATAAIGVLNLAATSLWAVSPPAATLPALLLAGVWLAVAGAAQAAAAPAHARAAGDAVAG